MAETADKKNEMFGKVFGTLSQSVMMSSPVLRSAFNVADMFRKPEEGSKETRLGNVLEGIKDYMTNQSKVLRNIVGVAEFTKDLLEDKKKEEKQSETKTPEKSEGGKPKENNSIVEYLDRKDNPYITAFNEGNVLLERIAKTLEQQLEYTRVMLKLDEEANEMARIKNDLDKVSRVDAARERALKQPRNELGQFVKEPPKKEDEGGGFGIDDILTGLGGLGVLKGGKGAIGRLFRGGAKAGGKVLPKVAPGAAAAAAGAAEKGGLRGLGKGALKGLGRLAGPLNLAIGAYDIYSTLADEELDAREKTIGVSETVGGMGGAAAGAAAGAAVGSVVPIVGTAIGGIAGGLLGYFGGSWLGGEAGEAIAGDGIEDGTVPQYDAMGNYIGDEVVPVPETTAPQIQSAPGTEPPPVSENLIPNDEFNALMARKSELLTRMDEIQPIDENGNIADVTPDQQRELDKISKELGDVNTRLEQDDRYRRSIGIVPMGDVSEIKPLSSVNPELIQPDYSSRQAQLDYMSAKIATPAETQIRTAAAPIVMQSQAPTNINSGGNVTNIIMNNDSLALPQMAYNLPTALA